MKKILIVEDEPIIAMEIQMALEKLGFEVLDIVTSGENAITATETHHPDLILMDIILEGSLTGIDAAMIIKEKYDIPLIYLTANADHATVERARATEPYGYINKPFSRRDLYSNIDSALYKHTIEKKLRESEERFHAIFDSVNDALVILDVENGIILDVNETMCRMTGYTRDELLQLPVEVVSSGEEHYTQEDALTWIRKAVSEGPQIFEWEAKDKAGHPFWVEVNMQAARIGGAERLILAARDITVRKKAEEGLFREQEFSHALIDSLPGVFYLFNEDYRFLRWNKTLEEISGFSHDEIKNLQPHDFFNPEHRDKTTETIHRALDEGQSTVELPLRSKSGKSIPFFFTARHFDIDGMKCVLGEGIDISALKEAEEKIQQLNFEMIRLQEEERRRIAGDLHDSVVQTLLAAKISLKEFEHDTIKENREHFDTGIQFLDRAIEELKEIYTNLYPSILRDIGLEATIRWYAKKHLETNGIVVELDFNVAREIPEDQRVHLYRTVQELFSNIVRHSGADRVQVKFHYRDQQNFSLFVTDNGIGFTEENSRESGHGMGSIRQRAAYLGCQCDISSTPNRGTTITIRKGLP